MSAPAMSYSESSSKRPRLSTASHGRNNNNDDNGPDEHVRRCSRRGQQRPPPLFLDGDELLESSAAMISVPVEIIFRQVMNQGQLKPLLGRSEAQTLLTINVLCEQLDSLTNLSEALLKEQETSLLPDNNNLIQDVDHPQLRSLHVMLLSYHQRYPAWNALPDRLAAILLELERCRRVLRHCADQNWSVSELLGTHIGMEKRMLSDVEDEVCRRIQLIAHGCCGPRTTAYSRPTTSDKSEKSEVMSTMEEYCQRKFRERTEQESLTRSSAEFGSSNHEAKQNTTTSAATLYPTVVPIAVHQEDDAPRTDMNVPDHGSSISLASSGSKPARSRALDAPDHESVTQQEADHSDDDAILADLAQQQQQTLEPSDDAPKQPTGANDVFSQDLTSPESSPKDHVEKENEPSQSSHSSSVVEDAAFRSQNAAEVLSALRKMT